MQLKLECNANKIDIDFHVKKTNKFLDLPYNEFILQQINKSQCLIGSVAIPQLLR